jgi:hypothetical protein
MSNAETQEAELKELEQQIEQAAEAKETQAATVEPSPSPEPVTSTAPEATTEPEAPVAESTPAKAEDNPMEWAKKKGFKSPEDMENETPPPPAWNPQPNFAPPQNGYGYPPPPPPQANLKRLADEFGMDPEDFDKIARLNAALTQSAIRQERVRWESEFSGIRRQTERQNEIMQLMQDPAFRDERVQREIHAVLDADPSIFQRERNPHVYAFGQAMTNLARKQLQQGVANGNTPPTNMPPFTAGGGNGSATSAPRITEREFAKWSVKDQEAFINSNGRIVPKR